MKITRKQLRQIIKEAFVAPSVPQEWLDRINRVNRTDMQDHLWDLVDAVESGDPDYSLDMLLKNLEDAEDEIEFQKGLGGETYDKTAEDYKQHPEWFN